MLLKYLKIYVLWYHLIVVGKTNLKYNKDCSIIFQILTKHASVSDSYCCPQVCQPATQWITVKRLPLNWQRFKYENKTVILLKILEETTSKHSSFITDLLYKYLVVWFIYNKIFKNLFEYFPGFKLKLRAEIKWSQQDKSTRTYLSFF